MGGDVHLESTVGQGAHVFFNILVGLPDEEPLPEAGERSAADRPDWEHSLDLKVLLVEDDEINLSVTRRLLDKAGATVVCARNGEEALRALDKERFDLVLMDVQMPVMDGVAATRLIRSSDGSGYKDIPIIAMTAHALAGDRNRFLAAGMDDYIAKPFEMEKLTDILTKLFPTPVA